ncbi:MAG TPA: hypothetical protein EYG67_00870 [Campylobacterales bacterium]|nr:hypothetical protein [Campylobacterales bacterium]HIP41118.1 hypothetical protein [Campylobacterales bacterium]
MRMILLIATLLFITACSPRYEIKTHYTQPISSTGKICLSKCEQNRQGCQERCDQHYNQCLSKAESNAKQNMNSMLNEYDRNMNGYERDINRYSSEMDRWQLRQDRLKDDYSHFDARCKDRRDNYACNKANELDDDLSSMYSSKPEEPSRPYKPTLSTQIEKFQENCSRKCNCVKGYDNCFVSCGGKLDYEKICVENCK